METETATEDLEGSELESSTEDVDEDDVRSDSGKVIGRGSIEYIFF